MQVRNRHTVEAFRTKDTSLIREVMAPWNSGIERQSLAEATVSVGQETQAHFHVETEEIYYILQGEGRMAIDEDQRMVVAGDAISIPPGHRHQIRNVGSTDLVILCCCVPAYCDADTHLCSPLL